MSDEQNKNIEQPPREEAASGEDVQANTVAESVEKVDKADDAPAAAEPVAAAVKTPPAARRGSSVLAWIAFLLVLVVAAGLAWSVWEQQRVSKGVAARLQAVEVTAGREMKDLDEFGRRFQSQLDSAVEQVQSNNVALVRQADELARSLGSAQSQLAEQGAELARQEAELARQGAELARYDANDREAWLLAEVQYLLRMSNQRLVMAGDVAAAEGLLSGADAILLGLDDVRLHDVRAAVAADLAAVRAVPRLDVEGVYLRLAALIEQAGKLVIFQLPERAEGPEPEPAQDWQGRLRQGYEAALAKLSNYIIIRRRDVPMQALMDPQWEGLVRQNLRMLLEQAQVALLSGNQMLYRESLERAQHWVAEFFKSDGAAARAMSREITQLTDMEVVTSLPDTSRSVQALDAFMKVRLQQGGAE